MFIFIEQIASVKILVVGVALGGVNAVQLFGFFRLRRQYAFNTVDVHQHKVRTSGCHAAVKRTFVPVFAFQHIFVNEAFKSLVAVKILGVNVFYLQKIVLVINVADNHLAKGIACFRLF